MGSRPRLEGNQSLGGCHPLPLPQPASWEHICRDSELEESNNYFKGLVSEVGLYELVLKWQEAD